MLLSIVSRISSWLTQIVSIISNQMSFMHPEQYMIGLAVCICLGYVLLRAQG